MVRRSPTARAAADSAARAAGMAAAMRAFANAPGSTYFYSGAAHKRLMEDLVRALRDRLGLHLVLGDFGMGKTTLCNFVLMAYAHEFIMGYLGNPFLDEAEFFRHMAQALGCECQGLTTAKEHLDALEAFLRRRHMERKVCVVFIDEAHLLDPALLDRLLVISNLQISGVPLVQVVLAGVPSLLELLGAPRYGSLNQRIGSRHWLRPLSKAETRDYVRHRLAHAGCDQELFSGRALAAVQRRSGGRPRLVNLLCRLGLEICARQGGHEVSPAMVRAAASGPAYRSLFREAGMRRGRGLAWLAGAPLAAAAGLAVLLLAREARMSDFWRGWLERPASSMQSAPAASAGADAVRPGAPEGQAGFVIPGGPGQDALLSPAPDNTSELSGSPLAEQDGEPADMTAQGLAGEAQPGPAQNVGQNVGHGAGVEGAASRFAPRTPDPLPPSDDSDEAGEWQVLPEETGAGTWSAQASPEPDAVQEQAEPAPAAEPPPAQPQPGPPPPEEVTRELVARLEPVWGPIHHGIGLPPELASTRVHAIAWDAEPERRMALIGEAIVRIGEGLAGGTVEAIGEDYVLVVRQGETYLLQIAPRR